MRHRKELSDAEAVRFQAKRRRVSVPIDNFGAVCLSFQYLKALSIDNLKVNGKFIRGMDVSGNLEREIVSSIVMFADKIKTIVNTWTVRRFSAK